MKKNIWILSHNSTPPEYGQWVRHYMFSKFGDDEHYNTTVFASSYVHLGKTNFSDNKGRFTFKKFGNVKFCFVNLKDYAKRRLGRMSNMYQFYRTVKKYAVKATGEIPDVIYASSPDPLVWLAGYKLAKKYNVEFIVETRDLWPETFIELGVISRRSPISKALYGLERFVYSKADKLVFTFEGGKDYLVEKGIEKDMNKVYSINNGVDLQEFYKQVEEYPFEDEDLSSLNTKCLVYTGSIGKANDLYTILHLALKLKRFRQDDVKILIFGEGLEKKPLIDFKEKHNLTNVVFKGRVDKKYIPSLLTQADINLISGHQNKLYRFGYSFNKLFDYMASGKPIVSTVSTKYDLIEKYDVGSSINIDNDMELYDTVIKYLNYDIAEMDALKTRAQEAVKNYDYQKLSEKFYNIIED